MRENKDHKSAKSVARTNSESNKKEDNVMNECEAAVAKYYRDMANLEQRLNKNVWVSLFP